MTDLSPPSQVPFEFFVSLCEAFASAPPKRTVHAKTQHKYQESFYVRTLRNWVRTLREQYAPLPEGTAATFFRFLFPDEDVSRKYNMQETRLAGYIADILGLSTDADTRGALLRRWGEASAAGCLGREVRTLLSMTSADKRDTRSMSDISMLLTELATTSAYSSSAVRVPSASRRKPRDILRDLYASASPVSASIITQIILKDLRPILYPLKETHYTAQLLQYNTKAVCMLTKEQAMKVWDPDGKLLQASRVCASIEDAVATFEDPDVFLQPKLGVPVPIPKCIKGRGCKDSLNVLRESSKVWVETKYDGERAQIHVEVDDSGNSTIKIFSKSKRDSTMDRYAVHSIIREALGLQDPNEGSERRAEPRIKRNVILEAEMVAYSDTLGKVDEFWRIRSLIASTAQGVRGASYTAPQLTDDSSQSSLLSNASDGGTRRLALVFFDVLVLDGTSLLVQPYCARRATLEALVRVRPGHAMLAERKPIDMHPRTDAEDALRRVFAALKADHEEGAVLKADESRYNDWRLRWVKLKTDYIPGYGDCLDLVVLGAGWNKERARELLVGPSVYTTFYIGALANAAAVAADPRTRPSFHVIFTCSYGLSREQLEEFNFLIRSSDTVEYSGTKSKHAAVLPYSFTLNPGLALPSVMLRQPILAEICGGGFSKAEHSKYYELRWPRMTKYHRAGERSWREGSSLDEVQQVAREAVGRDRPHKDVDDACKVMWGKVASPGVRCPTKRKAREEEWLEKLECADGVVVKARRLEFVGKEREDNATVVREASRPAKIRAFGSVTNVLPTPLARSDKGQPQEEYFATPKPTVERYRRAALSSENENTNKVPSALSMIAKEQEHSENACPALHNEGATPLTPPSSNATTAIAPTQEPYPTAACTIREFLQHAAVYLARDIRLPRPSWRAPSHIVVPHGHQLHTIEALLIACGWGSAHVCLWARFGVVFVDDTDTGCAWIDVVSRPLLEARAALLREGRPLGKPIFILGLSMLHVDKLEEKVRVLERAICRFE